MTQTTPAFYFVGNHAILDFINTRVPVNGQLVDLIAHFPALLEWLRLSGLLSQELATQLDNQWGNSEAANEITATAIELRNLLFDSVQQRIASGSVPDRCVNLINSLLQDQRITTKLFMKNQQYFSEKVVHMNEPLQILTPIAEAAVDFFCHYSPDFVKKCDNPECVLYFYDHSKNNTRRWCSQKTCGNRMKVRAYLERRRNNKNN
ncbi:CGNR zinc finger [compost metagenome]